MDVIKLVAEAKCPNCEGLAYMYFQGKLLPDPACPMCNQTGLHWPGLSREGKCPCGSSSCYAPRVADVTLEALMRLGIHIWFQPKGVIGEEDCFVAVHHEFDPTNPFTADTPEQAACSALLASVASPSPAVSRAAPESPPEAQ